MEIGRRVYYDVATGNFILDTGERAGLVVVTTIDQDISTFKELSERNRESFDVIELEYGQLTQDFMESTSIHVNLEKLSTLTAGEEWKAIEFSYPDPNIPPDEQEPIYIAPLSEKVTKLEQENILLKAQNQALTDRTDFHEDVLTEIILTINP
ncbi:hypothetical protein MTP04_02860 [Lysinibacillus sp. PLM2]|nr:hypothetical protein MTP04_02860 [Lysinibacillus sp. PLM2]